MNDSIQATTDRSDVLNWTIRKRKMHFCQICGKAIKQEQYYYDGGKLNKCHVKCVESN